MLGLVGFFTRLGRKGFGQPPPYFASSKITTSEKNPLTGKVPTPKYLDGKYAEFTPEYAALTIGVTVTP